MHLRKEIALSLKQHLFPHGGELKMQAQGFLDQSFDAAPHIEYRSNINNYILYSRNNF